MREIKFRGLRTDGKGWVYGYFILRECESPVTETIESYKQYLICTYDFNGIDEFEVLPESVGQFTGLTDNKGVYIYEGDVVQTNGSMDFSNYDSGKGSKREIYVNQAGFVGVRIGNQFDKENPSSAHCWSNYQLWNIHISLEIIGNIHQNPELI
jgi:uncharacterized phage protein (TIGR01671 family)